MSWDVMLFNTKQKITLIEEIDESQMEPTDFCSVFESHFAQIEKSGDHREIKGESYSIDYFADEKEVSNKMLSLYGEAGLYELVSLAKIHHWQIFDTGLGQMIDLKNPSTNGYQDFQKYLQHVLKTGK